MPIENTNHPSSIKDNSESNENSNEINKNEDIITINSQPSQNIKSLNIIDLENNDKNNKNNNNENIEVISLRNIQQDPTFTDIHSLENKNKSKNKDNETETETENGKEAKMEKSNFPNNFISNNRQKSENPFLYDSFTIQKEKISPNSPENIDSGTDSGSSIYQTVSSSDIESNLMMNGEFDNEIMGMEMRSRSRETMKKESEIEIEMNKPDQNKRISSGIKISNLERGEYRRDGGGGQSEISRNQQERESIILSSASERGETITGRKRRGDRFNDPMSIIDEDEDDSNSPCYSSSRPPAYRQAFHYHDEVSTWKMSPLEQEDQNLESYKNENQNETKVASLIEMENEIKEIKNNNLEIQAKGQYSWNISDWSILESKSFPISSEPFQIGSHLWVIKLFPKNNQNQNHEINQNEINLDDNDNGNISTNSTNSSNSNIQTDMINIGTIENTINKNQSCFNESFVGIFVELKNIKDQEESDLNVCARLLIGFRNPDHPKFQLIRRLEHRFNKMESNWGFSEFCSIDRLEKLYLASENQLEIIVKIQIIKDEDGILIPLDSNSNSNSNSNPSKFSFHSSFLLGGGEGSRERERGRNENYSIRNNQIDNRNNENIKRESGNEIKNRNKSGIESESRESSIYGSKRSTGFIGLQNQGATCYMNSLLQSLFMINKFKRAVYQIPTGNQHDPCDSIPLALQRLFYQMQYSNVPVSTHELTRSFGWDSMDAFMQHDVQEFSRVLLDELEGKMKGGESEGMIEKLFMGKMRNVIKCLHVPFESTREEHFYDLQVAVRGYRNLESSLGKYIQPELLDGDNKYYAEGFGLQDAKKFVEFIQFPPILHLHLERYTFDPMSGNIVKINDYFEFPLEIDLNSFMSKDGNNQKEPGIKENSNIDGNSIPNSNSTCNSIPNSNNSFTCNSNNSFDNNEMKYSLHSVLVHSGDSHGGHYFVFVRDLVNPNGGWLRFDDTRVVPVSEKEALYDNFGEHLEEVNGKDESRNDHNFSSSHSNPFSLLNPFGGNRENDNIFKNENSNSSSHLINDPSISSLEVKGGIRMDTEMDTESTLTGMESFSNYDSLHSTQALNLNSNSNSNAPSSHNLLPSNSNSHPFPLTRAQKWKKFTNAYMLVYIRNSQIKEILSPLDPSAIPRYLVERIKMEEEEEIRKRRERHEFATTTVFSILSFDNLASHRGYDLFNHFQNNWPKTKMEPIRVDKNTLISQLANLVSKWTGTENFHLWSFAGRRNKTFRLDAPLDLTNPDTLVHTISSSHNNAYLFYEEIDREINLEGTIFVFFKYFNGNELIPIAGMHLRPTEILANLHGKLCELAGLTDASLPLASQSQSPNSSHMMITSTDDDNYNENDSYKDSYNENENKGNGNYNSKQMGEIGNFPHQLEYFEEIKAGKIERLNPLYSLQSQQISTGDIICFQLKDCNVDIKEWDYYASQQALIQLRPLTEQEDQQEGKEGKGKSKENQKISPGINSEFNIIFSLNLPFYQLLEFVSNNTGIDIDHLELYTADPIIDNAEFKRISNYRNIHNRSSERERERIGSQVMEGVVGVGVAIKRPSSERDSILKTLTPIMNIMINANNANYSPFNTGNASSNINTINAPSSPITELILYYNKLEMTVKEMESLKKLKIRLVNFGEIESNDNSCLSSFPFSSYNHEHYDNQDHHENYQHYDGDYNHHLESLKDQLERKSVNNRESPLSIMTIFISHDASVSEIIPKLPERIREVSMINGIRLIEFHGKSIIREYEMADLISPLREESIIYLEPIGNEEIDPDLVATRVNSIFYTEGECTNVIGIPFRLSIFPQDTISMIKLRIQARIERMFNIGNCENENETRNESRIETKTENRNENDSSLTNWTWRWISYGRIREVPDNYPALKELIDRSTRQEYFGIEITLGNSVHDGLLKGGQFPTFHSNIATHSSNQYSHSNITNSSNTGSTGGSSTTGSMASGGGIKIKSSQTKY